MPLHTRGRLPTGIPNRDPSFRTDHMPAHDAMFYTILIYRSTFVVLYCNSRSLACLGLVGFLVRQLTN